VHDSPTNGPQYGQSQPLPSSVSRHGGSWLKWVRTGLAYVLVFLSAVSVGGAIGGGFEHPPLWISGVLVFVLLPFSMLPSSRMGTTFAFLAAGVAIIGAVVHSFSASRILPMPFFALFLSAGFSVTLGLTLIGRR